LLFAAGAFSQETTHEKPLPDVNDFLTQIKARLLEDNPLLLTYVYRVRYHGRGFGSAGHEEYQIGHFQNCPECPRQADMNAYQYYLYPFKYHTSATLLHGDLPADPKHNDSVDLGLAADARGGRRPLSLRQERGEARAEVEEILSLYDISVLGRQQLQDRPAILLRFVPRTNAHGKGMTQKFLSKLGGRVWVEENEHQIMRIEATTLENVPLGVSVLAKLEKGATFIQEATKVNNEVWLPSRTESNYSVKLLFAGFKVHESEEYGDFRKFTVEAKIKTDEAK
jgi:hypothetical protein